MLLWGSLMTELASYIWGDYNTDRIPSSGFKEPKKRLIREWGTWIEGALLGTSVVGRVIHATRTSLYADLAHAANTMAWVWNDPTTAYNGIYAKVGASGSGSWTRLTDLPYSFLAAQNDGDGTANAIEATTPSPIPDGNGRTLITLPIFATNTNTPVTVEFNEDGSPLTIKTSAGNDPVPGGLVAGMIVAGWKDGGTFRMLSDQASAAIQAAAEDAADRAEAAAVGIAFAVCTSRAAIKALDTSLRQAAVLRESGRSGLWLWTLGDYSAHVGYDTAEGLYMAADGVPATTGAWVRSYTGPALSSWFGVSSGATDNSAALSAWLKMLCEYNLYGHHNVAANVQGAVTCAPVNTDVAIMITTDKRGRITYTGGSGLGTLVNLNVDGIKDVTVAGLRIFGGDKCATGLRIEPLSGAPGSIIVRDCVVQDLRLVTGGSANGQGIRVGAPNATPGRYAEVTGCHVKGLYKDSGVTLANSGISIVNFDNTRCDHNTVEEIHHDGTNLIDADGLSIFSGNVSSIYRKQTVSCQNNVLRNCAGRFIKLQTNGNALVRGNACHLTGAITIITEWRWIDSQTGDCDVSENKLYADASWTGGGGDTLISLQTPTSISADNERVTQVARNNRVWTKKRIGTFFRPIVRDVAVDITWDVSGNQIYGPQALAGTTAADMGVNVTLVMTMVTLTAGGKYRLKFNDNTIQANTFILLSGSVSGDYQASTSIEAIDNVMHPLSVATPLLAGTSTWFSSALKLAGNNVGGTSGARVDQDIDLQYVLPGSEFYLGSGNYASAPVSKTFRALRKQTRRDITLTAGTTIQASVDNGATWKTAVLS